MYNSKLAVALKSRGKVLRENGENVYLPFGSEYSIFIKNLNTVRALVSVEIDGEDVGDGTQFIVEPKDSIDLERFIRNGNMNQGNRFKFIERTGAVEDHRGVGIEDGIVRVEFKFEKPYEPPKFWYTNTGGWDSPTYGGSITRGVSSGGTFNTTHTVSNNIATASVNTVNTSLDANDAGITVEGSISDQQFEQGTWFPTETTTHAIVLKILGETADNVQVRKPVTVKTKAVCKTCGHRNKATAKFCTECGTSLQLV